jgi:hypothetical protein
VGERTFSYEVRRDVWDAGRTEIALVRRTVPQRRSLLRRGNGETVVLFRRTFRPLLELKELELTYTSDREEAAAREQDAREAAVAADELADILRSHTGPADSGAEV